MKCRDCGECDALWTVFHNGVSGRDYGLCDPCHSKWLAKLGLNPHQIERKAQPNGLTKDDTARMDWLTSGVHRWELVHTACLAFGISHRTATDAFMRLQKEFQE